MHTDCEKLQFLHNKSMTKHSRIVLHQLIYWTELTEQQQNSFPECTANEFTPPCGLFVFFFTQNNSIAIPVHH